MTISLRGTVVAIPPYNAEPFIAEAVSSALSQRPEVRVLVSDNASTDDTIRRIEELESDRVTIHRQERNIGGHENGNWLLKNREGDVNALLCADDVMMPGHLNTQIEILAADDAVKLVGCNMLETTADLTPRQIVRPARGAWRGLDLTALSSSTLSNWYGGPSDFVFRRRDVKETRIDSRWAWLSDLDFGSRIVGDGWFVNPGHTGYLYRRHPGSDSAQEGAADVHEERREWAAHFLSHGGSTPRSIKALRAVVHDATLEQRLGDEWSRCNGLQRSFCGPVVLNRTLRKIGASRAGSHLMQTPLKRRPEAPPVVSKGVA